MKILIVLHLVALLILPATTQFSQQCPALYLRYSREHSFCKPTNPTCNIKKYFLSDDEKQIVLNEHNTLRSKLAMGKEKNLPTAANMLQMVWDDELAAVAQKHANQCLFEHDCSSCRRVMNFGVGQNLAIETTNSPTIPNSNWPNAIKTWYDEIAYFSPSYIDPFKAPPPEPTYGHFSQLFWAESWRIGCGYVLYQEGNMYKKLYVCNYGTAGNTVDESMYKVGRPCTACPENSCCGPTCGSAMDYAGLCKITDDKAPQYKPEGNYIFYCDFNNQSDCDNYIIGPNKWLVYNTLSGNYLGIVLNGGEESSIVFKNRIKPSTSEFCFVIWYRKGPSVNGQVDDNTVTEIFTVPEANYEYKVDLATFGGDFQQQFSEYSMNLGWDMETELKLTFSVAEGIPEQFFEIQRFYVTEGSCPQN